MFGISLASVFTAVVLVSMNFDHLNTDEFDMIPLDSMLHGVRAQKFPFNYIKINDKDPYDIFDFIDYTFENTEESKEEVKNIYLMTGQVFTSKNATYLPQMSKYVDVKTKADTEFTLNSQDKKNNQNYIMYAMGCARWHDDTTPNTFQLDIKGDDSKTEACKCVQDHFNTSRFTMDIKASGKDRNWWHKAIAHTCAMRNANMYVVEYAGAVNTERIMQRGFAFLFAALILMLVQNQNPNRNNSSAFEKVPKNSYYKYFVGFSVIAGFLFILMVSSIEGEFSVDSSFEVSDDSRLLTERDYIGSKTPDDYQVTSSKEEDSYLSTINLLRIVWFSGLCLYVVLGVSLFVCIYSDKNLEGFTFDALMRFLIDVPLIVGLTLAGVSVLIQNGYTNYNYIDINILLILSICFLQHISNLVKMFYDAVCRNTSSTVFEMLYLKNVTKPGIKEYGEEQQVKTIESEKHEKELDKVTSVLQFFGWFRVWIFLLVTLGTVLFLTMTNELVKTTSLGNFFSSQVMVFAFVLYVTNVGYDVVRELLPVEFERYHTDSTRFWVVSLYIIFYSWNQYQFHKHGALDIGGSEKDVFGHTQGSGHTHRDESGYYHEHLHHHSH
tara:strand:+ start:52492 stop:54315 length:1824 start_codon:yes stop_codon:yes gene_type:complete